MYEPFPIFQNMFNSSLIAFNDKFLIKYSKNIILQLLITIINYLLTHIIHREIINKLIYLIYITTRTYNTFTFK